jgi:hypothetical protein
MKKKKCSNSLAIQEMQIKTFSDFISPQENKQQMLMSRLGKGSLTHCWWEGKLVHPLWKSIWRFHTKLKLELPYDPATSLLCLYLKEIAAYACV